jgi:glycine/D-amino acid oxidase-like deaminating enzyme
LLGHRTTEELPSEADIVIVGTGITGTSAARFLSEDARAKGKSIVVLDAREACWCATGRVSHISDRLCYAAVHQNGDVRGIMTSKTNYLQNRTVAIVSLSSGIVAPK